ncbi:Blue-light-activated protein [compost metagenome]
MIAATRGLLEHALPSDIDLQHRLPPNLPSIEVDAGQLQMVLLNLLFNARDAIEGQGSIRLAVDVVELAGEVEGLRGRYVCFEVQDSGSGIAPEVLPRIFEPFFTTKAFGKGTGLGLSQAYGFAKQSNGTISVDSVLGKGTCMRLYLPACDQQADCQLDR